MVSKKLLKSWQKKTCQYDSIISGSPVAMAPPQVTTFQATRWSGGYFQPSHLDGSSSAGSHDPIICHGWSKPSDFLRHSNRFGYRFGYWFGYLTPNLIVQWRQNVPSPSPTYGQSIWGSSKLRACQRASTGVPWAPGTALRHDLGTLEATWMAHHGLGNLTTKGL